MSTPDRPSLARISPLRLLVLLALFALACAYAVLTSPRFQSETRGLAVRFASDALGRPVSFSEYSVSIVPPALTLSNVRVEGEAGEREPFFEAAEIRVSGNVGWTGRTLSLGDIGVQRPRLHVVVHPDGSTNLPSGLTRRRGTGPAALRVQFERLTVWAGALLFNEERVPLSGTVTGASALVAAARPGEWRGDFACRLLDLRLPGEEPLNGRVRASFSLRGRRLTIHALDFDGAPGRLSAVGTIDDLSRPVVDAAVTGDLDAGTLEGLFHLGLPFHGRGTVRARVRAGAGAPFRVVARARFPVMTAAPFRFEDVNGLVVASPQGLRVRLTGARFCGGGIEGEVSLSSFRKSDQVTRLRLSADGLSVESFFGAIGLPRTGLLARAHVDLALSWRDSPEHGDGGAFLALTPERSSRADAIPLGGGGTAVIRDGAIDFQQARFDLPASTLRVSGGFAIGRWQPAMSFGLDSKDLRDVDRLAQNLSLAISRQRMSPLGLSGRGTAEGTLSGSWSAPRVEGRCSAEDAEYDHLRLGTVYWDLGVEDGAFLFHPLRAYDGDASLELSGLVRYAPRRGAPRVALTARLAKFPAERVLRFLDLDYPVSGKLSGQLPIVGDPRHVTGAGDMVLEDARIYGQPVSRLTGAISLLPDSLTLDAVRGQIGSAWFGGDARLEFSNGAFSFHLGADAVDLADLAVLAPIREDVSGRIGLHAQGSGTLSEPVLSASAQFTQLSIEGHEVAPEAMPALEARLASGELEASFASPGRWSLTARGRLRGRSPGVDLTASVPRLESLLPWVGLGGRGLTGSLSARARLSLSERDGALVSAEGEIAKIALDRAGSALVARGEIPFAYGDGLLEVRGARLDGPALNLRGDVSLAQNLPHALGGRISGDLDPSLLGLVLPPGTELSGKGQVDLGLAGTLADPRFTGEITLAGGRLRAPESPFVLEDVSAQFSLHGEEVMIDSFRARAAGGRITASGSLRLRGVSLESYRLLVLAQDVVLRAVPDLPLQANADLTLAGDTGGATLRGELTLLSGTYTRDFAPTIASFFSRGRGAELAAAARTWKDDLALDVRIVSSAALEVRNNLARVTGSVDLLARGTLAQPVLLGQITLDEGGRVNFQDARYEIRSGTIAFGNPQRTEPVIDISAETEVKGYSIRVQAAGTLGERSRVQFQFTSDPPLSDEQVASLLLTGTAPETAGPAGPAGGAASSVVGSLAGMAFRPVTSRVQQLFRLDRFQIDPILQSSPGSSGGAVITVGKNLSKDLWVTYSYSAETNAQSVLLVEYEIDPTKVIQASKDENSVYSIDIKFRKRF